MALFSEAFAAYTENRFCSREKLAAAAPAHRAFLAEQADGARDADAQQLLKYYLATLPLTDVYDTPYATLAAYAAHAVRQRRENPWCRDLPEDVFVHFVATPRVNNESLNETKVLDGYDCSWDYLYDLMHERIAGLDVRKAVLEANYWCCETATYQTTDGRTLGPVGMVLSGSGRCGEESTFLVSVLRANGIPARQVYTPWWAHCDDNHAWVEAYVDGEWFYLGACEPEEQLNRGWFTAASGRAMLEHTRLLSDFGCDFEAQGHLLAREGSQVIVNVTSSYAPAVELTVNVVDGAGSPVEGAFVRLALVNESAWRDVAQLSTDAAGCARIVIGEGTLRVFASTDSAMADTVIDTASTQEITLTLAEVDLAAPADATWRTLDVHAPADHPAPTIALTPEQAELGRSRKAAADARRVARVEEARDKARAMAAADSLAEDALAPYYDLAFRDAAQLSAFARANAGNPLAAQMLATLTTKDFRDLQAAELDAYLASAEMPVDGAPLHKAALAYLAREDARDEAERLFVKYVLAPRALYEELGCDRAALAALLEPAQVTAFRDDPQRAWEFACSVCAFDANEHVKKLCGTATGALAAGQASPITLNTLFVQICRAIGVPARLNPATHGAEYYRAGAFVPVEAPEPTIDVSFASDADPAPGYFQSWSVARLERNLTVAGTSALGYEALEFYGARFENGVCTLPLPRGRYRLTTGVRLPNGDMQVYERGFDVAPGTCAEPIELKLRQPSAQEMLEDIALEPFALADGQGGTLDPAAVALAHGTGSHPVVVSFLEPSMEPTEHLLNELREQAERVNEANLPLVWVISDPAQLEDPTLARTLPALQNVTIAYDDFSELPEKLARRMFANPEKLPLTVLACAQGDSSLRGVYATAGYNVGTVDLLLKLITLV